MTNIRSLCVQSAIVAIGAVVASLAVAGPNVPIGSLERPQFSRIQLLDLRSKTYGNSRKIRVLLPPGYAAGNLSYPVFYFTDGRAAFDGPGWDVPGAADRIRTSGGTRDFIFVGIDNGGSTVESTDPITDRASEYLPYDDPSWVQEPKPVLRGQLFPRFFFNEVKPLIESRFRTLKGPKNTGIAGSSYGGLIALYLLEHDPQQFGLALIESPSLHVGHGALIRNANKLSKWRGQFYLGVGTAEGASAAAAEMVENTDRLAAKLRTFPGVGLEYLVVSGAAHGYVAWREQLATGLSFLVANQ